MKIIDIADFLHDASADQPAGREVWADRSLDLEAMVTRRTGPINWNELRASCVKVLANESKDLRIAMFLTLALLGEHGIYGLRDGLDMIRQLLARYWPNLYPPYTPSQETSRRVRTIEWLSPQGADGYGFKRHLRGAPLVQAGTRTYSLRDIEFATGKAVPPPGTTLPTPEEIDAAFANTSVEQLRELAAAARAAHEFLQEILTFVTTKEAEGRPATAVSPKPDVNGFAAILCELVKQLESRLPAEMQPVTPPTTTAIESGAATTAPTRAPQNGDLQSRADVIASLDGLCEYYRRAEPSSLVIQLLDQARKWVGKGFLDIYADLTPDPKDKLSLTLVIKPPGTAGGEQPKK